MVKSRCFDLEGRFDRLAGLLQDADAMDEELWRRFEKRWDYLMEQWEVMYESIPPLLRFGNDYQQEAVWPKGWRRSR